MTHALIENGVVRHLWPIDELPPLHPDLAAKYRRLNDLDAAAVREGWTFDGQRFAPPPPEPARPIVPTVEDVAAVIAEDGSPAMKAKLAARLAARRP